jgi:hypothetical protein
MSDGIDPGCVRLRLVVVDGRVGSVAVASERPLVAAVLRGRPADAATKLVPLLFALCGKAQGRAAELALAAARGGQCTAHIDAAVQAEAMREHLWRWLLDLPPLLGEAVDQAEFAGLARDLAAGRREGVADFLASDRIARLCSRLKEMDDPAATRGGLLPSLDAAASLLPWPQLDAGFCARPQWQGRAAETGAIARRPYTTTEGACAARWLARLDELRDWATGNEKVGAGGTASAVHLAPGRGRALIETARGLLMHEIALDGERIADYFIVAPTEWNFHAQGPLAAWLMGRAANKREELHAFAARAVAALDPCVRWELEWL